jgi:hypothetical protein
MRIKRKKGKLNLRPMGTDKEADKSCKFCEYNVEWEDYCGLHNWYIDGVTCSDYRRSKTRGLSKGV